MVMAYNIAAAHRLEPISGFDEMNHLQFTAPMSPSVLTTDNGTGEEPGLPSGSVVSMNEVGHLVPGATGTAMPMFLLWNTSSPDAYPSAYTANGKHLAGIPGTSAFALNEDGSYPINSEELLRVRYTANDVANASAAELTGRTNSLSRAEANGVVSYSLKQAAGNYTCWPAICGLELTSTEFDFSKSATAFAPNTLLTSPGANLNTSIPTAGGSNGSGGTYSANDVACAYQQRRGGYLTPVDETVVGRINVCGTVSRGVRRNENAVDVLYFWADRMLLTGTGVAEEEGD